MDLVRSLPADLLDMYGMTQVELAAALNVTQASISQWVRGARSPSVEASAAIKRAIAAQDTPERSVDVGLRRGPVTIPDSLWAPAFRPTGRYRLPLRVEWSGSDQARWRDAAKRSVVLDGFVQVLVEGSSADIAVWVDPVLLADAFDEILWPRGYQVPWKESLSMWKLL